MEEYKIELLNKSKKLIKSIENIELKIKEKKINTKKIKDDEKAIKGLAKIKGKVKKTKKKIKIRTLWVRRKKKN
tara:strand:+ start:35 stop:256 length:222 start_codon:yes stop_codon:yes gene_type:complete